MTRWNALAMALLLAAPALAQDPKDLERFFAAGPADWTRSSAEARPGVSEAGLGLSLGDRFQASQLTTPSGGRITLVTANPRALSRLSATLGGERAKAPLLAGNAAGLLAQLGVDGYESHQTWQPPPRLPIGLLFFQGVSPAEQQQFLSALASGAKPSEEKETKPQPPAPRNGIVQAVENQEVAPVASSEETVAPAKETTVAPVDSRHPIAPGETLYQIARKYGVTTTELALANDIRPGESLIREGGSLVIPAKAERRDRVVMHEGKKQHWLQEGDTPVRLAKLYGVTPAELRAANPGAKLRAGSLLVLPAGAKVPETVVVVP